MVDGWLMMGNGRGQSSGRGSQWQVEGTGLRALEGMKCGGGGKVQ
jgi:hypothetical protein